MEVINVSADVKLVPSPDTNVKAAPAPTAEAAVPPAPAADVKAAPSPTTAAAVPPVPATDMKAAPAPTAEAAVPPGLIAVALFSSLSIVVRHNDKATAAAAAKDPDGASPADDVPIAFPATAIDPHGLWGLVVAVRGGERCSKSLSSSSMSRICLSGLHVPEGRFQLQHVTGGPADWGLVGISLPEYDSTAFRPSPSLLPQVREIERLL